MRGTCIFEGSAAVVRPARKLCAFCEVAMSFTRAVLACELGQFMGFVAGAGTKKSPEVVERNANRIGEWLLKPRAQHIPILLLAQHKSVHPAIALSQHLDEKIFQFLPAVVTPQQQVLDGVAQIR